MFATICSLLVFFLDGATSASETPVFEQAGRAIVFEAWTAGPRGSRRVATQVVSRAKSAVRWSRVSPEISWSKLSRSAWYAMASLLLLVAFCPRPASAQVNGYVGQTVPIAGLEPTAVPPPPAAIFGDGSPTQDFQRAVPTVTTESATGYPRRMPWGNGHILVADPAEYPKIRALSVQSPGGLLDDMRANLFGIDVPDEWDFYNLINTDRMDFTDSPYSAGKGVTIMESGYTFSKNNDQYLHTDRRTLPEVLTRVGLTDEFELRLKWFGYTMVNVDDKTTGLKDQYFGGSDLQMGFKYEVLQQNDWRPMVTVLGETFIPTGTGGVSANALQPRANVVLGWGLRRWLYLKMSTGVDFLAVTDVTQVINGGSSIGPVGIHGNDSSATWHQSASLLYQATKRVGGFWEWYSFFSSNAADNRAQHYLDTGIYIYATPNIQFDVRIGQRVSNRVDGLFTGAGFSVRF